MKHIKLFENFTDKQSFRIPGVLELESAIQKTLMNPEVGKPIALIGNQGMDKIKTVTNAVDNLGEALIFIDCISITEVDLTLSKDFLPQDNGISERGGVILFEDFDRAEIGVKRAIIKLAGSRRLGDYVLPDKWVIVITSDETFFDLGLGDRFKIVQL